MIPNCGPPSEECDVVLRTGRDRELDVIEGQFAVDPDYRGRGSADCERGTFWVSGGSRRSEKGVTVRIRVIR